ncbi:hypothetical protein GYB59_02140 [bacterium]|nr:hypothetical protein [bacterium]
MADELIAFTPESWRDFDAMRTAFKAGQFQRRTAGTQHVSGNAPRMAVLLADVPAVGTAPAVLLAPADNPFSHSLHIVGRLPDSEQSGHDFDLTINGKTASGVSVHASAIEVQQAISSAEIEGVSVSLGNKLNGLNPYRWFLAFDVTKHKQFPTVSVTGGTGLHRPQISPTPFRVASPVDVRQVIPTGYPSPLRAGSVAFLSRFDGIGWGVVGLEPRLFDSTVWAA